VLRPLILTRKCVGSRYFSSATIASHRLTVCRCRRALEQSRPSVAWHGSPPGSPPRTGGSDRPYSKRAAFLDDPLRVHLVRQTSGHGSSERGSRRYARQAATKTFLPYCESLVFPFSILAMI